MGDAPSTRGGGPVQGENAPVGDVAKLFDGILIHSAASD